MAKKKKNNKYKLNAQKIIIILIILAMVGTSILAIFA